MATHSKYIRFPFARQNTGGPHGVFGSLVLSLFLLSALTLSASPSRIPAPALSLSPDTEASTNVVFDAGNNDGRIFNLSIQLNATASNNVVVAIGRDTDENGVLDRMEEDLLVGWDAGRWFYHDRVSGAGHSVLRETGPRRLDWKLILNPRKEAKSLTATDGNGVVFEEPVPATMFNAGWNLMRVTSRGMAEPAGLIVTGVGNWGIMVIFR